MEKVREAIEACRKAEPQGWSNMNEEDYILFEQRLSAWKNSMRALIELLQTLGASHEELCSLDHSF